MKKILLISGACLLLTLVSFSQGWTVVNVGSSTNITGVTFLDETHLFAVGVDGKIYGSSNGGANWSVSYNGTVSLNEIARVSASTAVAVGWDGLILRYNGTGWSTIASGTSNALFGVYFADASVGYAVGEDGIILKSQDGGLTWSTLMKQRANWFSNVHALDPIHVTAVDEAGGVFVTQDGGEIWTTMVIPGNPWLGGVAMTGPNSGWCCGTDGTLYYFNGTSLIPFELGTLDGFSALIMLSLFNDLYNGMMAGDFGALYQFANGDWTAIISPTTESLLCLAAYIYWFGDDAAASGDSATVYYCAGGMNGTVLLSTQTFVGVHDPSPGQASSFVYPVPVTQGVCFVKGEIPTDGIFISLSDMTGSTVHEQHILYPMTPVDLRGLRDGMYIARIRKGSRLYTQKVLVTKE